MGMSVNEIVAGDYYEIPLTYPTYPATNGYELKLTLTGPGRLTVTATANGDAYTATLPSDRTDKLPEGTYQFVVTATLNSQRTTIDSGFVTVKPDLTTMQGKVLQLEARVRMIEAVLDRRITNDVQTYSIAGRSVTNIPIDQLMILRTNAYHELASLTGKNMPSRTIKVNFKGIR
jgi:hypothetical protein